MLFLTAGTVIAMLMAKSEHQATDTREFNCSADSVWNVMSSPGNAGKWIFNLKSARRVAVNGDSLNVVATYDNGTEEGLSVDQIWVLNATEHKLTIHSDIDDRLTMIQEYALESDHINGKTLVKIHGWLNRILMNGVSSEGGIGSQLGKELEVLSGLCD